MIGTKIVEFIRNNNEELQLEKTYKEGDEFTIRDLIDFCVFCVNEYAMDVPKIVELGFEEKTVELVLSLKKKLVPRIYREVRAGDISLEAAARLMEIETEEEQSRARDLATGSSKCRRDRQIELMQKKIDDIDNKVDLVTRQLLDETRRCKDLQKIESLENEVETLEKSLRSYQNAMEGILAATMKITFEDVCEGIRQATIIPVEEKEEDLFDPQTGKQILRRDYRLAMVITRGIATGTKDVRSLIRDFYYASGEWGDELTSSDPVLEFDDEGDVEDTDDVDELLDLFDGDTDIGLESHSDFSMDMDDLEEEDAA